MTVKDEKQEKTSERCNPVFDNFFASQKPMFALSNKRWNPPADVYETDEHLVIKMEIADVRQEDLQIIAQGRQLTIRGIRHEDPDIVKGAVHLMEIRYDRFERSFEMPILLDHRNIQASYRQGFLIVRIPCPAQNEGSIEITVKQD